MPCRRVRTGRRGTSAPMASPGRTGPIWWPGMSTRHKPCTQCAPRFACACVPTSCVSSTSSTTAGCIAPWRRRSSLRSESLVGHRGVCTLLVATLVAHPRGHIHAARDSISAVGVVGRARGVPRFPGTPPATYDSPSPLPRTPCDAKTNAPSRHPTKLFPPRAVNSRQVVGHVRTLSWPMPRGGVCAEDAVLIASSSPTASIAPPPTVPHRCAVIRGPSPHLDQATARGLWAKSSLCARVPTADAPTLTHCGLPVCPLPAQSRAFRRSGRRAPATLHGRRSGRVLVAAA